ncbi:hypothetical protein J6590_027402 [Homalodisca vitripennis]|nr:hypothetical protein J6590_027402 [Homalodisca vitripennis]
MTETLPSSKHANSVADCAYLSDKLRQFLGAQCAYRLLSYSGNNFKPTLAAVSVSIINEALVARVAGRRSARAAGARVDGGGHFRRAGRYTSAYHSSSLGADSDSDVISSPDAAPRYPPSIQDCACQCQCLCPVNGYQVEELQNEWFYLSDRYHQ